MSLQFDWSHLQTFLAVAEEGSLSGAARRLGGSQPTMGRHIAALEQQLGVSLFKRSAGRPQLTPLGLNLLERARDMAQAANRLGLEAEGQSESLAGAVRITASEMVAAHLLPAILTDLHAKEPLIELEVVASDRSENLLAREADIAVRMYQPTQKEVFARKLGDLVMGAYATTGYLAQRGQPARLEDLLQHDMVGYDRSDLILRGFRALGMPVERGFFKFRCDNQLVAWQTVVAGFGIGFAPLLVGESDPRVTRLTLELPPIILPVWLVAHVELKTSRRVRFVFDALAKALGGQLRSVANRQQEA